MLKVKDKYDYRRELVEALRSGKYKQVSGFTSICDRYCALGVFALINNITINSIVYDISLYEKLGMNFDQINYIINMNDRLKLNFNQIADWIERLE